MSYAPYQRNTSGIVFFGEQGNQPTFYSDTNFLIQDGAAGHIQTPNLIISDGGDIGSVSDPDAISIASNGNVTMSQSLSVVGDLTVNGTTTTVDSTIVTIEDPVVIIGAQAGDNPYGSTADDNKDRGIAYYWNDGGPKIGFFGHDDSIRGFTYIPSGDFDAASGVITGPVGWAVFHAVSGDLVGNVTGNATTADTLTNSRYLGASGHATGSGLFDGSADQVPNIELQNAAILGQTLEATPDNNDLILIYDDTAGSLKRMTRGSFVSGLGAGSMDSFQVQGDVGSTHTINDADVFVLTGGSGIQVYGSGTDNLAIDLIVDDSTVEVNADTLRVKANGITETHLNTSVAGLGIAGGGGTALSFAPSELTDVAIADGDSIVFIDATDSNNPKKETLADLATLFAGNGLAASNSVLAVDLSEFSVVTLASGDSFATLDADGTTEQRTTTMDLGTFLAGDPAGNLSVNGSGQLIAAGSFTSFDIAGDTGTETVDNGETVTFAGSAGLDVAVTATNTVTYTIDISEYGTAAVGAGDSFLMLDNDGTTEQRSTVDQLGTYLAGTNITNTAGVLSVPDSTIDGVIFEAANFVDSSTIDFTVTAGTSVTAIVIDSSITEAKRSRSVVTDSTTSTLASTDDVSLVDASGGAVTITLTGVATSGKRVTIKKTDSSANAVTIQRDGSSTIDGATTKILYSQYESITIISDGTNWHII